MAPQGIPQGSQQLQIDANENHSHVTLRCNQQHPKVNANENHSQVALRTTLHPLRMPTCVPAGVLGCVCVCPCVCLRVHAGVPAGVRGCTHGGVHASLILKCRFTNFLHFFNRYPLSYTQDTTGYTHLYPQVLEKKAPDNPTRESLGLVMVHQSVHTLTLWKTKGNSQEF